MSRSKRALPPPEERRTMDILQTILREPTAPFHEHRVRSVLRRILEEAGIPCRLDVSGNLTARYRRGKAFPLSLTAHMDHPGFEVLSVRGDKASARWNGQVPPFDLRGLRLALWRDEPGTRLGTALVLRGDGRLKGPKASLLELRVPRETSPGDFGHALLSAFRSNRGLIESKALDDTAGCATVAACLAHLARRRLDADVFALFTRAEEVGFHGAFGALRSRTLPKGRPVLVLECSKTMPGAEQGKGPVIRIGDKACVFDPDTAAACVEAAKGLQALRPGFRFQRRLMDGGTCEASAFGLFGLRSLCIALPLGNYHNAGPRGVACESIGRQDFLGAVDLLSAFASLGLEPARVRERLSRWIKERFGPAQARRLRETRCP